MVMYMLILITHLVLKWVLINNTFILQPLTQATHAFADTAIKLDYFC